jgi:hypothetical protein
MNTFSKIALAFLALQHTAHSAFSATGFNKENLEAAAYEEKSKREREIKSIMRSYSFEHNIPVVLTPSAETEFVKTRQLWDWTEINGIGIGHLYNQNLKKIKVRIDKNLQSYSSLQKEKNDKTFKISGIDEIKSGLSFFPEACKLKLEIIGEPKGVLAIDSASNPLSFNKRCYVLIYSFSVNGIDLEVDEKNHTLIASQKKENEPSSK